MSPNNDGQGKTQAELRESLALLIRLNDYYRQSQKDFNFSKSVRKRNGTEGVTIYTTSLYEKDGIRYCIANIGGEKSLYLFSVDKFSSDFDGETFTAGEYSFLKADLSWENFQVLKEIFPFTAPVSLRDKRTTIGCGDRLGLATSGHIRAIEKYDAYPVLAQQSIRELTLTRRNYHGVVADAAFLVFQEGFEKGYGADGDHLKTLADIDTALDADMPMITLDLTEVMNPEPALWDDDKVKSEYSRLEQSVQDRVNDTYNGRTFTFGDQTVSLGEVEAMRCALMYWKALEFSREVDRHLRKKRGDSYDLEISIDETTAPTLPSHHLFIISELKARGVVVNSLAPRFIGEFQKGIDYIGDIGTFEEQFKVHCEISRAYGNYKISIHSGSDKFSVYPAIGKHTDMRVHLKTAGTSWLEAIRTISNANPQLYRTMHRKAFEYFDEATKLYHITADLSKIRPLDDVADDELPTYLEQIESRQLLHITYGGLLNDPEVRDDFFGGLAKDEDLHTATVAKHIEKHISLLGVKQL